MDDIKNLDIIKNLDDRLNRLKSNLEKQLQLAKDIQKLSSIVEFPHIKGFDFSTRHIASAVSGGDYFDVLEIKNSVLILLSAASNHSTAAMLLRRVINFDAKKDGDSIVNHIRLGLQEEMNPQDNLSIMLMLIDKKQTSLSYCNVGDNVGWIQTEDNLVRLARLGERLSGDNFTFPKDVQEEISFGSRVILVSYGLILCTNEFGEPFGVTKMESIIAEGQGKNAHDLKHEILFALHKHTNGDFNRDATLVIVDVKEDARQYKLRLVTDG